MPIKF
jgi:hypothetical protein